MPESAARPAALPALILCADDFALSRSISVAIAGLARQGCINAISCMAALPGWAEDARLLDDIEAVSCGPLGRVQVGLHLVLSDETPVAPVGWQDPDGRLPGPDRLLALALLGRLPPDEVEAEIDRQFAAFRAARGRQPDFVDAHQHTHLYPGIRRAVLKATLNHAPQAWVRVPDDRLGAMLARPFAGKAIGSSLHATGLRRQLDRVGLRSNASFAGHYDFAAPYPPLLDAFLRHGSATHLVMCHPGGGESAGDGLAAARRAETMAIAAMPLAERYRAELDRLACVSRAGVHD